METTMHRLLLALCLLLPFFTGTTRAADEGSEAQKAEVTATTQDWVEAFNARDPARIAALYAPEAVFWGTISKTIRTTPEAVLEYFQDSVTRRPRLQIAVADQHPRVLGDIAINSGAYTSRETRDGQEIVDQSRFTFVYRRKGGHWMIIDHHSSRVPGT